MKHIYKTLSIAIFFIISFNSLIGQTVTYQYDALGNRELRTITLAAKASLLKSGTIDSSFVKEEKFEEQLNEQKINIYPNPTKGVLRVEISGIDQNKNSSINVYNLKGNLVYSIKQLTGNDIIDLSNNPLGTYVLKIQLGDKISSWKIIKE